MTVTLHRAAVALVFLAGATAARAAPVYLDCKVSSDTEQKRFSVTLDEASGQVTHTSEKGGAFNAKGFFAANKVGYQYMSAPSSIKVTVRYEIDRTSLRVQEEWTMEPADSRLLDKVPAKTTRMAGACTVVKASSERKF